MSGRKRWVVLAGLTTACVLVGGLAVADAPPKPLLRDAKLGDWTRLEPVNALGPIAPNGTWAEQDGRIVATGTAAPWTIQVSGDPSWTDYYLTTKVTIREAGPKIDHPVYHAEFDRYLPHFWYPTNCQHSGQYRYRFFAGEFDWGSDAAVFVRYQSREDCYRVQLSTEYQELILWHGLGGYLQVVPCELKAGRAYKLDVAVRGRNIQVSVDGKKKIDYWHRTLPSLSGKIGLGAYRSTVAFGDVTVTELPAQTVTLPPHQPRFRTRVWRTLRFIFDGNEPITIIEQGRSGIKNMTSAGMYYHQIKLVPGYRPYMHGWIGILADQAITIPDVDEFGIKTTGENSAELVLEFDGATPKGTHRVHTTDRVTFDRVRGTYRHDVTDQIEFIKDCTLPELQFFDPLTYNNKEPGRGVKHRWLPAGHRWGIFRGADGKLYHHPNTQGFSGNSSWKLSASRSLWVLYPDRAGCPAFEYDVPGSQFRNAICHWGYDWHQSVTYGHPGRKFKKGERVTIRHAFTAYPPREGERLFAESTLHPVHHAKNWRPRPSTSVSAYCDPHAYPICDPAGVDFSRLYNTRTPSVGFPFAGHYKLDRAVGHNDSISLRLDGPSRVLGHTYHHMIDQHVKKYLCTVWLKTAGVEKAPTFTLKYSFFKNPADVLDTGLAGDNDWTKFAFITSIPALTQQTYDSTDVTLELEGKGTVWMDDFSIRPIEQGEKVEEVLPGGIKVNRVPGRPFRNFVKDPFVKK